MINKNTRKEFLSSDATASNTDKAILSIIFAEGLVGRVVGRQEWAEDLSDASLTISVCA